MILGQNTVAIRAHGDGRHGNSNVLLRDAAGQVEKRSTQISPRIRIASGSRDRLGLVCWHAVIYYLYILPDRINAFLSSKKVLYHPCG